MADMKLPERGKYEWNLNTILLVCGIISGISTTAGSVAYFASQLNSADRETKEWQQRHEQLHRDRLQQTAGENARQEQRIAQAESRLVKLDNLEYRITVAEQAGLNTAKSIERLTETVNAQSADIRVMREIVERQFGTQFQRPSRR